METKTTQKVDHFDTFASCLEICLYTMKKNQSEPRIITLKFQMDQTYKNKVIWKVSTDEKQ